MGLKIMVRNFSTFFVLAIALSCGDPNEVCCDGPKEVVIGEPFSIKQGETINVESSIIDLTFKEMINDSLCPEDVECVTQGTLKISVDTNGTVETLSIGDVSNPKAEYKNYTIELQQLVYPTKQFEKGNRNSTYAVQMLITRS